jgi:tripartite-type tricarboxylate transporter receptor subunit TctC
MEQWLSSKTLVKFGGVGAGAATDDVTKVAKAVVGLPIQLISGYKGTADIRLAIAGGELHGIANSWESFKSTWTKEIETGAMTMILQTMARRHPELPNVPMIGDYAKTDEAKKILQVAVYDYGSVARPYVFAPGTPKDRVRLLRKAFSDTYKDSDFIADVQRARLDMNPIEGEELEKIVARIYQLEKPLVEKVKDILK